VIPHEHDPETCAKNNCTFLQRSFKRSLYKFDKNTGKGERDVVNKYGKFISRTLLDIAFMGEDKDSD